MKLFALASLASAVPEGRLRRAYQGKNLTLKRKSGQKWSEILLHSTVNSFYV